MPINQENFSLVIPKSNIKLHFEKYNNGNWKASVINDYTGKKYIISRSTNNQGVADLCQDVVNEFDYLPKTLADIKRYFINKLNRYV